jgi:hypothetical protein
MPTHNFQSSKILPSLYGKDYSEYGTAFNVAALAGHLEVVKLLVARRLI